MTALEQIQRLWKHAVWADAAILSALERPEQSPADAVREFSHVLGAEETWLARLEGRPATLAIWPELARTELASAARRIQDGYGAYLAALRDEDVERPVSYTNTKGHPFETPIGDILLHVALHGQYHRGKINLLLRQANAGPSPVDFISFVRGVPAAVTSVRA
jgi:uncharacterized damage-inducible protein DinB